MNILMVSSYLPYPLFSGGHIRLYNLIKELSRKHRITLICEKRDYQTEKDLREVKEFCKAVLTFDRKKQWSAANVLKAGFSTYSFLMVGHTNNQMKKTIAQLLDKEKFDVIHVETFYVMQNVPIANVPIVLVEHNIEYMVYKRYVEKSHFLARQIMNLDIAKLRYWEERSWQRATKLVAVSEDEKRLMNRKDVEVVPNGVDVDKFKMSPPKADRPLAEKLKVNKEEKTILFIGDFRWIANRDAVLWIIKEIWPKIKFSARGWSASGRKIKLWIVSREIPSEFRMLTYDSDVIFDENSPKKTEEIFQKADILLAPIRIGGGTSFKILEAMASGVPVITTHLGIEGIAAKSGEEVLISDYADGIAEKTMEILSDEDLYNEIVKKARKLIEEKYNWDIIVSHLEEVYKLALKQ